MRGPNPSETIHLHGILSYKFVLLYPNLMVPVRAHVGVQGQWFQGVEVDGKDVNLDAIRKRW
jgi:hypothetical protein